MKRTSSARSVLFAYLLLAVLFTLGASLIWAINTIFLLRVGGLDLFQAMLVNSVFTLAQMAFEVPTGVIADTIGRRASIALSMLTLALSTLLYVLTPQLGWGILGFALGSVLLGLGYTFQTGAIDAWLVDALDAAGSQVPRERVFAWGQMSSNAGMVAGSLLGGILGQANLVLPYLVRAAILAVCFVIVLLMVHDLGFEARPLRLSTVRAEGKRIFVAGLRHGWHSPVIRPLLWVSAISGLFFMYGFYAWQPYVLRLVGRDYVWLLGVVQAGSSAATIIGNALVGRVMSTRAGRRDPVQVLVASTWVNAALVVGIGAVGIIWRQPGLLPASLAIGMWLIWGVIFGVQLPVRMSYINEHISSAQRATVLSLDAFFADAGGAVGQPALGWISERASISLAWLIGGVLVAVTAPMYRRSGEARVETPTSVRAAEEAVH
ncbi:MAG TPA: MFS transporter [Coriobacteriia bacterium]|nr:MFS transporter [Coriobacteriia bacterium]